MIFRPESNIEKRITERQKTILDLPVNVLGMFIFGLICWQSWGQAWLSVESTLRRPGLLRLPLWPSKFVLVLGSSFLVLQFMISFVSSIHKVLYKETRIRMDPVRRPARQGSAYDADRARGPSLGEGLAHCEREGCGKSGCDPSRSVLHGVSLQEWHGRQATSATEPEADCIP